MKILPFYQGGDQDSEQLPSKTRSVIDNPGFLLSPDFMLLYTILLLFVVQSILSVWTYMHSKIYLNSLNNLRKNRYIIMAGRMAGEILLAVTVWLMSLKAWIWSQPVLWPEENHSNLLSLRFLSKMGLIMRLLWRLSEMMDVKATV